MIRCPRDRAYPLYKQKGLTRFPLPCQSNPFGRSQIRCRDCASHGNCFRDGRRGPAYSGRRWPAPRYNCPYHHRSGDNGRAGPRASMRGGPESRPRISHRPLAQSSSASRFTAGNAGFLDFSQTGERPRESGERRASSPISTASGIFRHSRRAPGVRLVDRSGLLRWQLIQWPYASSHPRAPPDNLHPTKCNRPSPDELLAIVIRSRRPSFRMVHQVGNHSAHVGN